MIGDENIHAFSILQILSLQMRCGGRERFNLYCQEKIHKKNKATSNIKRKRESMVEKRESSDREKSIKTQHLVYFVVVNYFNCLHL